jgi:very-short-patch-repair endonuclease
MSSNAVRWTEEQLKAYVMGKDSRGLKQQRPVSNPVARAESKIERRLDQQLAESGLPKHQRNYFFLPDRDLELDFAWPALKVAVEVQGMAHRIKGKWKRDIEKRALAMLAGWRVLEVDGAAVRDGRAIEWTKKLIGVST